MPDKPRFLIAVEVELVEPLFLTAVEVELESASAGSAIFVNEAALACEFLADYLEHVPHS